MAADGHLEYTKMAITSQPVCRWRWRYFRLDQIQDGGSPAILENTNGDISAKDYSIQSMFGSREGFSGTADLMTLFLVWPNLKRRLGRYLGKFKWQNFEWRHLCNGSSDLLHVWFSGSVIEVGWLNGAICYWAARHDATGDSPNMLFLGREASTPLDLVIGLPPD